MMLKPAYLFALAVLSCAAVAEAQVQVKDINTWFGIGGSAARDMHSFAGGKKALFRAYTPFHGFALHVTDGTPAGTDFLQEGPTFRNPFNLGNRVLMSFHDDLHGEEL